MRALPSADEMWRACLERDASYDGLYVTAVRTTGIFCRPSCPARKPKRENVEFFSAPGEALLAGYRPCRRCRPLDLDAPPPAWVRELVELAERAPAPRLRDADLRARGIDPVQARRYFKIHYGMTFQAYQRACRLGSALAHVRGGGDLLDAGFDSGFESASGFRDAFQRLFGEPPGRGRAAEAMRVHWITTPLGPCVAAATEDGVSMLEFADRRGIEAQIEAMRRATGRPAVPGRNAHLERLEDELGRYFDGALRTFTVPLVTAGTPFQEQVWSALRAIAFGAMRSYDEIARAIGRAGACRAVGRANGQNRLAILIPCHRVVGHDGRLCGYGGGLWRKQYLLDLEQGRAAEGDRPPKAESRRAVATAPA
jgi:AraC family transcriptional regulator of adaptative response/methylated-DNA-[protein]-cysteine methyltransferase